MNLPLLARLLGVVVMLIAAAMAFSLPWASPVLGYRAGPDAPVAEAFEIRGCLALLSSIAVAAAVGGLLLYAGRRAHGPLYRREAMAIVGLSWVLATVLGALPYYLAGVGRGPAVHLHDDGPAQLYDAAWWRVLTGRQWRAVDLADDELAVVRTLVAAGARGLAPAALAESSRTADAEQLLRTLADRDPRWSDALLFPRDPRRPHDPPDRADHFRIRWVKMGLADVLFESQSGFSTTGATVLSDLEDPQLVPHCLLFWRSSTHFLGGLGIIVLFVVVLGQGSAGKALMRAEMPGPSKEGATARMQHTAWLFAGIYCGLNLALTLLLWLRGLSLFDALCHAFGTMATGGFSTWNASVGQFDDPLIDWLVVVFMVLAGTNFTLLYFLLVGRPGKLLADVEWRTYVGVLLGVSALVFVFGWACRDFDALDPAHRLATGFRQSVFQVVSIVTTTGYGTADFNNWNSFSRGVLFLLMFVGGCAGSTGGGLKVIRHVLFLKVLRLEIEQAYHPTVVRPLRLGGQAIDDVDLRKNILVYFGMVLVIFVFSWIFVVAFEPDATWGAHPEHKLIDSASSVAATLNNIGPGLGIVGASQNYGYFSPEAKLLFTVLMMLGRVEIFVILVLFSPRFWRAY